MAIDLLIYVFKKFLVFHYCCRFSFVYYLKTALLSLIKFQPVTVYYSRTCFRVCFDVFRI